MPNKIILASKSKVRKDILHKNDIECVVEPSNVDEDPVKDSLISDIGGNCTYPIINTLVTNLFLINLIKFSKSLILKKEMISLYVLEILEFLDNKMIWFILLFFSKNLAASKAKSPDPAIRIISFLYMAKFLI